MQIIGCFLIFIAKPIALGNKDQFTIQAAQVDPVVILVKWIDIVTTAQGASGRMTFGFHLGWA
jgi:hypothetical protein